MATSSGVSCAIAIISAVFIFSGMQMYKFWLTSSQLHTILGGYLGSIFFVLILTACGNLETLIFGRSMQVKMFPEVLFCLIMSIISAGTIHRVSATTCVIFSSISLYYINKHSQKVYAVHTPPQAIPSGKKKK